jgi:DNA-directed RNA polymerase III subunit RPC6
VGSVEDVLLEDESRYRLAVVPVPERSGATLAPCGVCPVIDQCREGGHISPQSCAYYAQWLADM